MLYEKLVSEIYAEGCHIEWEVNNVRCLYVPRTGKRYRVTYSGYRIINLEYQRPGVNGWEWDKV